MEQQQIMLIIDNMIYIFSALTVLFIVPEKVSGLSPTAASTNSVSLEWNNVSGICKVNYSVTWTPPHANGSKILPNNEIKLTIENLTSNFRYAFRVQAQNQKGPGEISDIMSYVTGN